MQTNVNNLDAAIEYSHRALISILKGNPKLYQDLFADRDDVTLGNPFGPFARGSAPVAATLAGAASYYRDPEVVTIQLVAKIIDNIALGGRQQCIGAPNQPRRHGGPSP